MSKKETYTAYEVVPEDHRGDYDFGDECLVDRTEALDSLERCFFHYNYRNIRVYKVKIDENGEVLDYVDYEEYKNPNYDPNRDYYCNLDINPRKRRGKKND